MRKGFSALFFVSIFVFVASADSVVVNDKITVEPRQYVFYSFYEEKPAVVTGRFEAKGGDGNDIHCLLLDEDSFTNFRNGHSVNTWYNSGRITVANVYAKIPAGRYFLVFDNRFSWLKNKVVTANIKTNRQ